MRTIERSPFMQSLRVYLAGWQPRWVRPTVWQSHLERIAAKRRQREKAWAHQSVSAFQLEPLESRILLAADLTGVIQSSVLPNPALEGSLGSAIVQVVNQGDLASNRMEVGVYISQDAKVDGSDILIATASSGSGVSVGKPKGFTVPFTISTQLDPGTYQLLAKVDNANATDESNENNNVAAGGTINVAWQFGSVPGKTGQTPLTLRDADSTVATFSLTGPGTGEVVKNGALWDVRLTGTDTTTALTITTNTGGNGRLTLNSINVAGSLASFTATTTDLVGALTVNGPLPVVNAGTIVGGVVSANAAPVALADIAFATENGPDITIDVFANDTGANTIVEVIRPALLQGTVDIAGNNLVYSVGQAFNSLKAGAIATENFSYLMQDAAGAISTATVTVTITGTNDDPEPVADEAFAQEHQPILINVLENDRDPDAGDTLRIQSIGPGTFGTTNFASSGGVPMIYYTPTLALRAGEQKDDQFRYTVVDSTGALSTQTVTVTITGVNDAPVANIDRERVLEGNGAIPLLNVLTNDTDPDNTDPAIVDTKEVNAFDGNGRPSQIVITSAPSSTFTTFVVTPAIPAIQGIVSIEQDGQVTYTPPQALRAGQELTETIFYTMKDAAGLTSSSSLVVIVIGENDGPEAIDDNLTLAKNAESVTIDVFANDRDADTGDPKIVTSVDRTVTLDDGTTVATKGRVTFSADGKLVYAVGAAFLDLPQGETAFDRFSYTMTDGIATATAQVTVTITGVNTAPVASNDPAAATENGAAVYISVLANDNDADAGDTKTVVSVSNIRTKGVASLAADGSGVIYTIGGAFQDLRAGGPTAIDTFSYTMADHNGALSMATVEVTVTGVNDPLTAIADLKTVQEDAVGRVRISVLANDRDADFGDIPTILSLTTTGLRGSAVIDGSDILYTPNHQYLRAGQSAIDRFSYRAVDGGGVQSVATVTVTVIGANDPPRAVDNTVTLSEDAAAATILVLANDTDVDLGDTKRVLTVVPVSVNGVAPRGTMSVSPNGTGVVYSMGDKYQHLLTGQSATETFSYTMTDAAGTTTSTATVTVTINGVTDGPKAVADNVGTVVPVAEDGGPIRIDVLGNDTNDANPGDLRITSIDGNGQLGGYFVIGSATGNTQYGFAHGIPRLLGQAEIIETANGQRILYTPLQSLNAGETGTDTLRYTLNGVSVGVVTITVRGANDAPTAKDDTKTVDAGTTVFIDVLANDEDLDTRIDPPLPPQQPIVNLLDVIVDATPVDIPDTKKVVGVDVDLDDDGISDLQGTVAIAAGGGTVTYTAGGSLLNLAIGDSATETFTYTMQDRQDSLGVQSTATVTVTVTGTNQAPLAEADSATATENGTPVTLLAAQEAPPAEAIMGTDGDDVLTGGANRDDLTGGLGADTFTYVQVSDSTALMTDRIMDFSVIEGDKIDLSQIDADTSLEGDNAFVFSTDFTGQAGQLVLTKVNGVGYLVEGDVDGDGLVDFQVDVRTSETLTTKSFLL